MKRSFKVTALALSAMMAVSALAGCGSTKDNSGDVTKVTYWMGDSHAEEVVREFIDNYNQTQGKKDGIEIEFTCQGGGSFTQNLELALQSGTAPDIWAGGSVETLAEKGYIMSYDDVFGDDVKKLYEKYDGKIKDLSDTYKGKLYAVPQSVGDVIGLIYNKDMFKAAGIVDENGEAKPPTTIAEMREDAKILTNAEKKEYGIIYPKKWDGWWGSDVNLVSTVGAGRYMYNPATNDYDYDYMKPYAQLLVDMQADGSVYPGADSLDNDTARALFAEGGIGMKYGFSFDVGVLNDQFPAKCDWGATLVPVVDEDHAFKSAGYYGRSQLVNAASTVPVEKLKKVMELFLSDEYDVAMYKACVSLPVNADAIESVEITDMKKGWDDFLEISKNVAEPMSSPKSDSAGLKGIKELFLEDVWSGKITVDEMAEKATETSRKARQAYVDAHPEYDTNQFADPDWEPKKRD